MRIQSGWFTGLALICSLFITTSAQAVDYFVFGQVFQISSEDAADETIAAADLTGPTYPFARIAVHDQDSGALLGQADAGENGQFTVTMDLPAGSHPNIECRVYKVLDGGSTQLPAAREGINSYPAINQTQGVNLKVMSDELIEYGDAGFRNYPGVGLVFTRVGKVEIPYIDQNTALANRPVSGLADFTGPAEEARAAELGVYAFKQSPFARRLLMFGDFGLPGGACSGDSIDWYQVKVKKVNETAAGLTYDATLDWMDPMHKTRTEIITVPVLEVHATTKKIGPYQGMEGATPLNGLYWVNRNEVGGAVNVFYSFPDLRVNWVSNAANGLYEISLVYYKQTGTTADGKPLVQQLPNTCFASGVPVGDADKVALHKLYLRVNNQPLVSRFDHIYLKTPPPGNMYFTGEGSPDSANVSDALDFNAEGLCDIMHLASKYEVETHFTAHHEGEYMRGYSLNAISNDSTVTVSFDSDNFASHTTATNPLWAGTAATGKSELRGGFSKDCAYRFRLHSISRLQNGYNHVQRHWRDRAYYVTPLN